MLTLAVVVAVSGCAEEDQALPLAPPELAVAAEGDVLAADSAGLVCQWGPVEGVDGMETVLCHREEEGGDTADDQPCICWYLVIYQHLRNGDRIKVHEDFLGCENCNGQDNCTEEQIEIDEEYDDPNYYNPTRREPSEYHCSVFKDTDFKQGHGTHGHSVGLIQPKYRTYRPQILAVMDGIVVTSDWRCPRGNAHPNVGGSKGSWHMEGVGGDFAKANGDTLTQMEYNDLSQRARDLDARYSRYGDPCTGCFQYKTHIHIDWRWSS